jgi:hypothetical protein
MRSARLLLIPWLAWGAFALQGGCGNDGSNLFSDTEGNSSEGGNEASAGQPEAGSSNPGPAGGNAGTSSGTSGGQSSSRGGGTSGGTAPSAGDGGRPETAGGAPAPTGGRGESGGTPGSAGAGGDPEPATGGAPSEGGVPGEGDAPAEGGTPSDGGVPGQGGASEGGAPSEAGAGGQSELDCLTALGRLDSLLRAAQSCTPGNDVESKECGELVHDVCGCQHPVTDAQSEASVRYTNAVTRYLKDCGPILCLTCTNPPTGQCSVGPDDEPSCENALIVLPF